ncbi:MAG: class I SAM-dependent methyltransferase [Thermodesulfobacteriota bacterium]
MKLNWAERWAVNNPLRIVQQLAEIRWMRRKVGDLSKGERFLEVGSGRGVGGRLILRYWGPRCLHLTDLDMEMIKRARRYPGPAPSPRVRLLVADAVHLPYPSGIFDAVFGFGVMHHVPSWREALAEVARVLRPGGIYFMEELYPSLYANELTGRILLHPKEDRFDSISWHEACGECGFEIKHSIESPRLGILAVAELKALRGFDQKMEATSADPSIPKG